MIASSHPASVDLQLLSEHVKNYRAQIRSEELIRRNTDREDQFGWLLLMLHVNPLIKTAD